MYAHDSANNILKNKNTPIVRRKSKINRPIMGINTERAMLDDIDQCVSLVMYG